MAKKKLFRTDKNADATRKAKPLGYRYKNLDPMDARYFKKPTAEEIEKFHAGDKKMKRIIAFEDRPERSDKNQKNKLGKGGSLDIQFPNSNLYLVGKGYDTNGNYVVKVTFPNATAFSIQTGGTLNKTESNLKSVGKISELTEDQILEIEKEVVDYVDEFGSKTQKSKLKKYSGFENEDGGEMTTRTQTISGVKHSIIKGKVDYNSMETLEDFSHPLGTVYSDGKYGYVASGYDWLRFDIKDLDRIKSRMKDGGSVQRYTFGIEYKPTASSKIFRKTSLTMVGGDTEEMNDAITKNAEALKKQEGWYEIKITKTPIMKNGGGVGFAVGQSIIIQDTNNPKLDKSVKKIFDKYNNIELVIEKIETDTPYNTARVFVRDSGEKAPFDVILNPRHVKQYANGGGVGEITIKIRGIDDNKIYTWTLQEVIDRINQDNATDEFNYDESDWVEGFKETLSEFYSLDDAYGKPLNYIGNLKQGGSLKRSKASIKQDKSIKALHAGKRFSTDGNTYYENRENRSDVDRRLKLERGGKVGGRGFFGLEKGKKITNMNQLEKDIIILTHSPQFNANNTLKVVGKRQYGKSYVVFDTIYWDVEKNKRIGNEEMSISKNNLTWDEYYLPKNSGVRSYKERRDSVLAKAKKIKGFKE